MEIKRTPPRYPRKGPSCLLVLLVLAGIALSAFIITNAEQVRDTIIPTPIPDPTRSATEYALLADLSEENGALEEAVEYYETAVRLDATKPKFFIDLINLLVRTGDPIRALEVAEQAVVLAPDNEDVWTAVAAAHIANGDRLYDLGDPTGGDLEYAQAVRDADQAININLDNATAYAYKAGGLVFPQDPDRYAQAQEAASTAVSLEPGNPIAHYYMGVVFDYQAYYANAREQYLMGIDADNTVVDLYIGLAYNYFGTGDTSQAILSFEEAVAIDPNSASAYDGLAYMYLQLGDWNLAEEYALQSTELNPNVARAHGRLGEAYFNQQNYEKAIEALKIAVELYDAPTDLNARFFNMLATAYIFKDTANCPQAVPIFEKVSETNSAARESALEGLANCRRAQLESSP